MLYNLLKIFTSIFFNILNKLLGGKLPPFGSAAVIVEEQDRYLVIELPHGRTVFPGGFMNWRETPKQAARREGREETGLELRIGDLIGYYSSASSDATNMSTISFVYQAKEIGGTLKENAEGTPCWLSENELRERMSAHSLRILDDYLQHRLLSKQKQLLTRLSKRLPPAS